MKISTKYYQMRRKNKKGLILLGALFLLIVAIVLGATRFFLSPTSINSNHSVTSEFKNSSSKTKNSKFASISSKDVSKISNTNKPSQSTTESNLVANNQVAIISESSSYSPQTETQENISVPTTTSVPTVYSANYKGYIGSSTTSYDEALAQAKSKYEAFLAQQQQTAESIAQSFVQNGYETRIIQDQGGN